MTPSFRAWPKFSLSPGRRLRLGFDEPPQDRQFRQARGPQNEHDPGAPRIIAQLDGPIKFKLLIDDLVQHVDQFIPVIFSHFDDVRPGKIGWKLIAARIAYDDCEEEHP